MLHCVSIGVISDSKSIAFDLCKHMNSDIVSSNSSVSPGLLKKKSKLHMLFTFLFHNFHHSWLHRKTLVLDLEYENIILVISYLIITFRAGFYLGKNVRE